VAFSAAARVLTLLLVAAVCSAGAPAAREARIAGQAPRTTTAGVVGALRSYLDDYGRKLIAVVALEHYFNDRPQRGRDGQPPVRIEAEYAIVVVPGSTNIQGYRDVISVDGKAVAERAGRFKALFEKPTDDVMATIRRINYESRRFYNSPLAYAFYNPATCLDLLSPAYADRQTFDKDGEERVDGQPTWVLRFSVAGVLKNGVYSREPLPDPTVTGRGWIEPTTGVIRRCELTIVTPTRVDWIKYTTTLRTSFRRDAQLDLLVPVEHTERTSTSGMQVNVRSTYTDYRRFESFGRIKKDW
jgi:hypothetical protein